MAGTADASEGRREWPGPMGSAPPPAVRHPPTVQHSQVQTVLLQPTQPSCIHIPSRRQPFLLFPHRQDRWLEDPKEEAVRAWGS